MDKRRNDPRGMVSVIQIIYHDLTYYFEYYVQANGVFLLYCCVYYRFQTLGCQSGRTIPAVIQR